MPPAVTSCLKSLVLPKPVHPSNLVPWKFLELTFCDERNEERGRSEATKIEVGRKEGMLVG
jgi:hypothetical protein